MTPAEACQHQTIAEEAAERLRKHDHDQLTSPYASRRIVLDIESLQDDRRFLADAWLAEHPADDGEPVTEEWLRGVGFVTAPNSTYVRVKNDTHAVAVKLPSFGLPGFVELFDCNSYEMVKIRMMSRGQLRKLCSALGIPLKESP